MQWLLEFLPAPNNCSFLCCRYTSQVHLTPPVRVISRVYDSTLFDHLDSTWDFKPGPTPQSTWLSFTVDFAFKSPLYHHIATVFFDEVGSACADEDACTVLQCSHQMSLEGG